MGDKPGRWCGGANWWSSKLLLEETGWKGTDGVGWKEGRVEERDDKKRQKKVEEGGGERGRWGRGVWEGRWERQSEFSEGLAMIFFLILLL